ncbi:Uncharacterised protein [Salmonella enterica subsp. enterica serovar Bovismorbificans]|nr:Uncharacterised protein [Salmonella enterica subsp. enterica serovar Bovismorbificans]
MAFYRPTDLVRFHTTTVFFDGNLRRGFRRELYQTTQIVRLREVELSPAAARQAFRQRDIAVTNADQTADLNAYRFPQSANFAVAPFRQRHVIPLVNAFAAAEFNGLKCRRTIFQLYATA